MNRLIALGLALLAGAAIGATAVNGLHAQNRAPGAYAVLDLRAINSPDVFKTLPSKTGDFDGSILPDWAGPSLTTEGIVNV
jgi:hypothetical protein